MGFSVVIPAFKASGTIERCLNSLTTQRTAVEIIVVQDGEDPELEAVVAQFPTVRLTGGDANLGAQKRRNQGLSEVKTGMVMFLDADDYVSENYFDDLGECVLDGQWDICVTPHVGEVEVTGWRAPIAIPTPKNEIELVEKWLLGFANPPCCVIWKTGFVRRIRGWNIDVPKYQDFEIVIRGISAGAVVKKVTNPRVFGIYTQSQTPTKISNRGGVRQQSGALHVLRAINCLEKQREQELSRLARASFYVRTARDFYSRNQPVLGDFWMDFANSDRDSVKQISRRGFRLLSYCVGYFKAHKWTAMLKRCMSYFV